MQWLKDVFRHLFIPHEGNDNQPHILRTAGAAALIGVMLFAEGALFIRKGTSTHLNFLGDIISSVLVSEANDNRAERALASLKTSRLLEAAAIAKAQDMAAKGYFAHMTPDGHTPWYWFDRVGYNYVYAGENLAVNFTDSKDVTNAWMNSPEHRANILNNHFTEIGIATAHGTYEGHDAVFVVQLFGRPKVPATTIATVTVTKLVTTPSTTIATAVSSTQTAVLGASSTLDKVAEAPAAYRYRSNFIATESPDSTSSVATTSAAVTENYPDDAVSTRAGSTATSIIANPRRSANVIAILLMLLVSLAIGLKLFHVGFAYPRLLMNGFAVLLFLLTVISINHYVILAHAKVF